MPTLDPAEFASAHTDTLALVVQESDKRIAAQVQVMLASDSRSNTLLSASTALAAAAFGVAAAQYPTQHLSPLVVGSTAFAVIACVAAGAAVRTLWPVNVDIQGWSPRLFRDDVKAGKAHTAVLAEVACLNQQKIDENAKCNEAAARRVKATMVLLAVAPLVGALAAALSVVWLPGH